MLLYSIVTIKKRGKKSTFRTVDLRDVVHIEFDVIML